MSKIVNFSIWFIVGAILVFLVSNFSLGSKDQIQEAIEHSFAGALFSRAIFSTIVGMIWTIVAYFLYKAFADIKHKKLKFWRYFLLTTLGYFIVALISTLIFIQKMI
jgi:hypothetical protein